MHAIAWRTFRASQRVPTPQACRIVAGVRRSFPSTRKFHRSAILHQVPEEPSAGKGGPADQQGKGIQQNNATSEAAEHPGTEGEPEAVVTNGEDPSRPGRRKFKTDYGSAANRSNRNKTSTGVPPVVLPDWLPIRNVILAGEQSNRIRSVEVNLPREMALRCRPWMATLSPEERQSLAMSLEEMGIKSEDLSEQFQVTKAEAEAEAIKNSETDRDAKSMQPLIGKLEGSSKEMEEEVDKVLNEAPKKIPTELGEDGAEAVNKSYVEAENIQQEELPQSSESQKDHLPIADHHKYEPKYRYSLPGDQYTEILVTLRAALLLEAPKDIDIKDVYKPATLLLYPKDGGLFFLDSIVEEAADHLHADILRLDPLDLAEVVGSYIGENVAWTLKKSTAMLGYETQEFAGRMESIDMGAENMEKFSEDEDDLDKPRAPRPPKFKNGPRPMPPNVNLRAHAYAARMNYILSTLNKIPNSSISVAESPVPGQSSYQMSPQQASSVGTRKTPSTEGWTDLKITTALEALLDSVSKKRKKSSAASVKDKDSAEISSTGLIVQIRDFKELISTSAGSFLMSKFEELIKKRWQGGENITVVGTTSALNQIPDFTKADVEVLESNPPDAKHRTIIVVPNQDNITEKLDSDERSYIRSVNLRHTEDMVAKMSGAEAADISLRNLSLLPDDPVKSDMEDSVWPLAKVYRVAALIVGQLSPIAADTNLKMKSEFVNAIKLIQSNDETKFSWAKDEKKLLEEDENDLKRSTDSDAAKKRSTRERITLLKEKCNFHEKKLISGVVYPDDIRTSFSDVRSPPETIDALKTLTSLSLIRPEAFSYGVLATDKIPGLLLYGPPGTGKTMLAKAVAKESGATVLDVSGADLFNLYVGEGEKNVKALFSLAKKLTPCVVFIDEADAIFGSRGGDSSKRTSHRELINQFLREWDGMNDMSAFIMVATNRPFDLDDAVLRRLPRRLLVDLPTQTDREAILNIHLTNEVLDDSVSLSKLASETPFYSGSDLKNVSVAAALACVREENEDAAKHTGPDPYVYPPKRTLSKRHFEKALEEISASISEDMSTLTAVRKFDEKYGDRKGRRKKKAALGFGGLVETDRDSDTGRVRKIQVV